MSDIIALITIIIWPVVPLFWIPVHGLKIFKKIGLLAYVIPFVTWLPLAYLIYLKRSLLLQYRVDFPLFIIVTGVVFLIAGSLLHIWTGRLLGIFGLIGLPEISKKAKGKLVIEGPFSVVRHPTYLAHTMIFSGVFLITGVIVVGVITLLDLVIINTLVIPLEEKELLSRFGEEYKFYEDMVPRYFPRIWNH